MREIKPSDELLFQMRELLYQQRAIDLKMEIVKERILREAGEGDLSARIKVSADTRTVFVENPVEVMENNNVE